MQFTYLGKTGLRVSRLCLGTMNFGTRTTPAVANQIMDRALELGLNFLIPLTSMATVPKATMA
ncbi:hypothetical protein [Lactiplantibacillus carotarum]|uniref:hypothetical protein n=1 Tax=Lactiplantibacillus carotarum TaxID=2993456 RepID=UPI00298F0CB9|nr:hypothetical protein [Lactiplantibacillus carotarum]